jgi:hypothetical protein
VPASTISTVELALESVMTGALEGLVAVLSEAAGSDPASAYCGDETVWKTARQWASSLPLRASAQSAVWACLPQYGAWRYEDVLDVSVTGVTTRFMRDSGLELVGALRCLPSQTEQYLADVWDGINDGAWDQIDASCEGFLDSLRLPAQLRAEIRAYGCRIQHAHFGKQDMVGWELVNCDLLLADLRSCWNIESADFSGTNWWSAILPPVARYSLSRRCENSRFLAWCDNPPWSNPYYTARWPSPFD